MGKHRDRSNRTPKITLGKTQFSKIGLPRYEWHDIYHLTLTLSWPVFLAVIGAIKVYSASDIRWGKKFVDILSTTPDGKRLINWIGDAQNSYLGWNLKPIMAMDVYEHAYFIDFGAARPGYIDAFIKNLCWETVAKNYDTARR